jgi:hypothetical protein
MNGVDRSNQLRRNLTVHRGYERRVWRPLWYYILDVCAVNSYLIWKGDTKDKGKRGQRQFRDPLTEALLNTPYPKEEINPTWYSHPKSMPLPNWDTQGHCWSKFPKRGYCVWCKEHAQEWKSKRVRPALAEIVNGAGPAQRQRQSKTYGGCEACSACLCQKGGCFKQYHSNNNSK